MTPEERADSVVGVAARDMHGVYVAMREQALEMIRAAIAEEREACAKVCESVAAEISETIPRNLHTMEAPDGADECAAAIRARK
jgi:hypothetical protein